MLKLQGSSIPPIRFGWFRQGHDAILEGAIRRLPPSPWKTFLLNQYPAVAACDTLQDVARPGPPHVIRLEDRGNLEGSYNPLMVEEGPAYSWEQMNQSETQAVLRQTIQDWQQKPLTPETLHPGENLYHSIVRAYGALQLQLAQIQKGMPRLRTVLELKPQEALPPSSSLTQTFFNHLLLFNIAELSHYVGDLFMPLHVTKYTDWGLGPETQASLKPLSRQSSHFFLEGQVLSPEDYTRLVQQAESQRQQPLPYPGLSQKTLGHQVLGWMQESYRNLFDLLRLQKTTLAQQARWEPQAYQAALKKSWQGMTSQKLQQAQAVLASTLQAVWLEAGCPNFLQRPMATSSSLPHRIWNSLPWFKAPAAGKPSHP